MACLNLPTIPDVEIPGLSLPNVAPAVPQIAGNIPLCCGGQIGAAINPNDFIPPLPIPPGPVVPTAIIILLGELINALNSAIDTVAIDCPLDGS